MILDSFIHEHGSKLKSLNISGNNAIPFEYRGPNGLVIEKFSDRLQKLVKTSITLQHLDLSNLDMDAN